MKKKTDMFDIFGILLAMLIIGGLLVYAASAVWVSYHELYPTTKTK